MKDYLTVEYNGVYFPTKESEEFLRENGMTPVPLSFVIKNHKTVSTIGLPKRIQKYIEKRTETVPYPKETNFKNIYVSGDACPINKILDTYKGKYKDKEFYKYNLLHMTVEQANIFAELIGATVTRDFKITTM